MIVKGIIDEDFVNYKKPSMYIIMPYCTFKCDKEFGCTICQNSALAHAPGINISVQQLVQRYITNPITQAIVLAGLEPFDTALSVADFVRSVRQVTDDDIVIYTGYTEDELGHGDGIKTEIYEYLITHYTNLIIKFGRYIPNQESHYDEVLGVNLASPNQYAKVFK